MSQSFLQTFSWLKFQESIGHRTWRFDRSGFSATVIEHKLPFNKSYFYIPHGPSIILDKISGGLKNEIDRFYSEIKSLARREGSMFVKIEPLSSAILELIYRPSLRRSFHEIQPAKTVVLDLIKSEAELLGSMHHKTRYNISVAQRHGLSVSQSDDVEIFWKLLKETAARDKFFSHTKEHYANLLSQFKEKGELETKLFLARQEDQAVAGAIVLVYQETIYYLHGASDYNMRSLMAPYLLHWEIIRWAKNNNLSQYDFWGIDAQRWPGVTRFKLGWGGRTVERPGSFDLVISPFWYLIYHHWRRFRH